MAYHTDYNSLLSVSATTDHTTEEEAREALKKVLAELEKSTEGRTEGYSKKVTTVPKAADVKCRAVATRAKALVECERSVEEAEENDEAGEEVDVGLLERLTPVVATIYKFGEALPSERIGEIQPLVDSVVRTLATICKIEERHRTKAPPPDGSGSSGGKRKADVVDLTGDDGGGETLTCSRCRTTVSRGAVEGDALTKTWMEKLRVRGSEGVQAIDEARAYAEGLSGKMTDHTNYTLRDKLKARAVEATMRKFPSDYKEVANTAPAFELNDTDGVCPRCAKADNHAIRTATRINIGDVRDPHGPKDAPLLLCAAARRLGVSEVAERLEERPTYGSTYYSPEVTVDEKTLFAGHAAAFAELVKAYDALLDTLVEPPRADGAKRDVFLVHVYQAIGYTDLTDY
jgi:hypothetical protein